MNKASGGDVIPAELFQILEDDAVEVLHSICQQIWKTQQWLCAVLCWVAQSCLTLCDPMDYCSPGSVVHGDSPGKKTGVGCHALLQGIFPTQGLNPGLLHCRWIHQLSHKSVFTPIPKKSNAKECSNYHRIVPISHTSKVIFKILQARLQQYKNRALPDIQAGFRKGRGTRDQIANNQWITEKSKGIPEKHLLLLHYTKAFDYVQQTGKFLKRWKYQTTLPVSWETCMQVKKQQLELVPYWERIKTRLYIVTLLV